MKKYFGMVITCMMALGLVSCSAADDDLTGDTTTRVNTVTTKSNFSLLSYSQTTIRRQRQMCIRDRGSTQEDFQK